MEDHEDISCLRIDPKAWDRQDVWQKLWGSAVMKASRRLNRVSPGQVEDIAIESITKMIEELPHYPKIRTFGELRAFTTVVADRLALSHLRSLRTDEVAFTEEVEDVMTPAARLQIKNFIQVVISFLAKLKPEKRNLLYDFHLHGLRHKEIAAKYHKPIGNVGSDIKRALEEARECLPDYLELRNEFHSLLGLHVWLLFLFWS